MKTQHVILTGHEIYKGILLVLLFNIDGINYRRVSVWRDHGMMKRGQLLWWKNVDELEYVQDVDLEVAAQTFVKNFKENNHVALLK